jgi:ribosomal protein S18 acetylase RimI-like enzyme
MDTRAVASIIARRAQEQDVSALAPLFDAYRQFYDMPVESERTREYLSERMKKSESVIFVAADESGQLLGFCQLYPTFCSVFLGRIFVLYDLFVSPDARRSGVGKALLGAAEHYAVESGALRMNLRTAKTNVAAQALYESSGWKRDELFHTYSKRLPR